jgi:hypothetical protein
MKALGKALCLTALIASFSFVALAQQSPGTGASGRVRVRAVAGTVTNGFVTNRFGTVLISLVPITGKQFVTNQSSQHQLSIVSKPAASSGSATNGGSASPYPRIGLR